MPRAVIVGLDGSPESQAATEWAAREAKLRDLPLTLVSVLEPVPEPVTQAPLMGPETSRHWIDRIPREYAEGLRLRHPGVTVGVRRLSGSPGDLLPRRAREDEALLVLGSRGLSGLTGFLVGSVALAALAHAGQPAVLVRAGEQAVDEHLMDPVGIPSTAAPYRPVVLGLDTVNPHDAVVAFAFEAAARRSAPLRVVHADPDPRSPAELAGMLRPWARAFPQVAIVDEARSGGAAQHVTAASQDASLLVVGRRIRRTPIGPHIGPVVHTVLRRAACPVAVVPHH
ncbi:universal stress protein [Streptomyces spectabilis]|uniref:Nucleotide-binding universal stress UspA family protein n=1 Tax=Streptomyces spectabilis TaxID=68270 RepID=A0A5P2XNL0_STRST|nr:universal stress protein [Streptomyces spectabilis]MBB5102379.1 nucleotide-binding universal stress UspA family protein [Streptomyces spectabilis]MCI3907424.1 universal stress protein [Streptomyces spectabilis]QEV64136.1 universal stress protein [Streptomyces spectabilis]GGV32173.1 stress-inducible protein [Streptomyces spectabilis]